VPGLAIIVHGGRGDSRLTVLTDARKPVSAAD